MRKRQGDDLLAEELCTAEDAEAAAGLEVPHGEDGPLAPLAEGEEGAGRAEGQRSDLSSLAGQGDHVLLGPALTNCSIGSNPVRLENILMCLTILLKVEPYCWKCRPEPPRPRPGRARCCPRGN